MWRVVIKCASFVRIILNRYTLSVLNDSFKLSACFLYSHNAIVKRREGQLWIHFCVHIYNLSTFFSTWSPYRAKMLWQLDQKIRSQQRPGLFQVRCIILWAFSKDYLRLNKSPSWTFIESCFCSAKAHLLIRMAGRRKRENIQGMRWISPSF